MAYGGGFTGPYPMGAGGTDPPVGYDLMEDVGMQGFLVDQRGPHYFDVRAEAVYMTPDETFGRDIAMTSLNVTDDNIVLRTSQLDYDWETGFRVIGRFDICPLAVLEFGYMGIFDWESSASFTDPNPVDPIGTGNLFSLFSQFGTNPNTVAVPVRPDAGDRALDLSEHLDQFQFADGRDELPPLLGRLRSADFGHVAGRLPLHEAEGRFLLQHEWRSGADLRR